MKRLRHFVLGVCVGLAALGTVQPMFGQQTGTLVFDMKNFTFGEKVSAKAQKQIQKELKHGGTHWGMVDRTLLIPMVNDSLVKVDGLSLTRFGDLKKLELAPGDYTITCIGYEFAGNSTDMDKVLSKNAFFNLDVLKFTIEPGKTTTIEVSLNYEPQSAWFRLARETMYVPDVAVRVLQDGTQVGEAMVVSRRTEKSVAWDDYHGPLKF
ncbi:MAG: hypothetical protein ABSE27_12605 [Acidobacteriaceae bacterium]